MKVQNRLSYDWYKEQLVLFAQDVVEVAEQLLLPLHNVGLVIIVESHENPQQHRECQINIEYVEYRDDMQMQTQEIQQRNIQAPIDQSNKYAALLQTVTRRFCVVHFIKVMHWFIW